MYDLKNIWPKWETCNVIGSGSFGKVYEIVRKEYGVEEHSALKVISIPQTDSEIQSLKNDGMTDKDTTEYFKGVVNDFIQEIQLMTKLKGNSNIVAYEDFTVIEKSDSIGYEILIRMELLTGLPTYLRENRFRVFDVIQLGIDMCKALEMCREMNIVHRDIKPDNIFVSSMGNYKLGDFGVARTIEKTMAGLSRKGTYSFMAPEIYNGNEYGFESDIYSLGVVLYKLLNNNRDPFLPSYPEPVQYSDMTEAFSKRIQGMEMPAPANSDNKLAQVILKACAYSPVDRYSHPRDFRNELENIILNYADLNSEVFSENGISYYTNNSVFNSNDKSDNSSNNNVLSNSENDTKDENGTFVLESSNETTVLDDKNFFTNIDKKNSIKTQEEESIQNITFCPVCNNEIKREDKFCGHCGYNLLLNQKSRNVCPNCGFEIKTGVNFCGKCGFKIS